jgi:hypothetical protein
VGKVPGRMGMRHLADLRYFRYDQAAILGMIT